MNINIANNGAGKVMGPVAHGLLERAVENSYLKNLNLEGMSVPWRTFQHGCG